jgi:hypothetical protein
VIAGALAQGLAAAAPAGRPLTPEPPPTTVP